MTTRRKLMSAVNRKANRLAQESIPHLVRALLNMAAHDAPADAAAMVCVVEAASLDDVIARLHIEGASAGQAVDAEVSP